MLMFQDPRPADWADFVTGLAAWHQGNRQRKAELIVREWLSRYEGDNMGPLDRRPMEVWIKAFLDAGFFAAEHTITEVEPNRYEESLVVHTGVQTEPTPELFRLSTPERCRRFSWVEEPEQVGFGSTTAGDLHVYRCRSPLAVFGTIRNTFNMLPNTEFWLRIGQESEADPLGHDYTEWIVAPGTDVRRVTLLDLEPNSDFLYISEGEPI